MKDQPFWRRKTLGEMSLEEWESLCDGCGRCCLLKLEDDQDGTIEYTDVCCDHLDVVTCRCTRYGERLAIGAECVELTPDNVADVPWLPPSCAYKLVAAGHDLSLWHPLVSGEAGSVHEAGASVTGWVVHEAEVDDDDIDDHIIDLVW